MNRRDILKGGLASLATPTLMPLAARADRLRQGQSGQALLWLGRLRHADQPAGELFKQLIGAPDIVHIPYKGSAPGVADLASGHIPMMTPNVGGTLIDLHRTGKVRILAVTSRVRLQV